MQKQVVVSEKMTFSFIWLSIIFSCCCIIVVIYNKYSNNGSHTIINNNVIIVDAVKIQLPIAVRSDKINYHNIDCKNSNNKCQFSFLKSFQAENDNQQEQPNQNKRYHSNNNYIHQHRTYLVPSLLLYKFRGGARGRSRISSSPSSPFMSSSSSSRLYDRSVTTFDPNGRLLQVEYSTKASQQSSSLSSSDDSTITSFTGTVATAAIHPPTGTIFILVSTNNNNNNIENENNNHDDDVNIDHDAHDIHHHHHPKHHSFSSGTIVHRIDDHLYMVCTGYKSDVMYLVNIMRQSLYNHYFIYGEKMTIQEAATTIGTIQHEATITPGTRPLACTALVLGINPVSDYDENEDEYDYIDDDYGDDHIEKNDSSTISTTTENDVVAAPTKDTSSRKNNNNNNSKRSYLFKVSPGGIVENCWYNCIGYQQDLIMNAIGSKRSAGPIMKKKKVTTTATSSSSSISETNDDDATTTTATAGTETSETPSSFLMDLLDSFHDAATTTTTNAAARSTESNENVENIMKQQQPQEQEANKNRIVDLWIIRPLSSSTIAAMTSKTSQVQNQHQQLQQLLCENNKATSTTNSSSSNSTNANNANNANDSMIQTRKIKMIKQKRKRVRGDHVAVCFPNIDVQYDSPCRTILSEYVGSNASSEI